METTKREITSGGPLNDAPDHYKITVRLEGDDEHGWEFVRKPDGTYWEVAVTDLFPRTGGTLAVHLGNQIVGAKELEFCERHYRHIREAEAATIKILGFVETRRY